MAAVEADFGGLVLFSYLPRSQLEIFKGQGHGLLKVLDQALDVATEFILKSCK